MAKPVSKKTKRRICLILILVSVIIFMISLSIGKIWVQIIEKSRDEKFLKEEIVRLRREENYLRSEVQKLQDPDYIARYAREKYLYSRDGEFTIRIP